MLLPLLVALPVGVFAFSDLDGFERCLRTDRVVEEISGAGAAQTRVLAAGEIQQRCVASAVKLLAPAKNADDDLAYLAAARRLAAPETALDLVGVLVDHTLAGCNDLGAFEVLTRALARPRGAGKSSPFVKARAIVKRCLNDREFRGDFIAEKDRPREPELSANVCAILLEEKVLAACRPEKP